MWNPHAPLPRSTRQTLGLAGVVVVVAVWSTICGLELVTPGFLPAPWAVAKKLWTMSYVVDSDGVATYPLLMHAVYSAARVFAALFCIVLVGVPVGTLMGASPKINAVLAPLLDPLRSAPIVAALPIMVMWFGIEETMKVAFLWLGAVVYLIPMVRDAVRAVSQDQITMALDIGATPFESVRHVVFPLSRPRIADAIIVSVGIEWTYITVAEYTNTQGGGLGTIIATGRKLSAMDQVFAGIFVILLLALITDIIMRAIKRFLYPWETE